MEVEEARQEGLTIKNFCLAAVALRTFNNFPKTQGRLSNAEFSANTKPTDSAGSLPPVGRQKGWPHSAVVAARIISVSFRNSASSAWTSVLVISGVLDHPFDPPLWNARSVFLHHKNKPFLLFFLVSLKTNKWQALKPQTKYHVSSTTLESLPWIKSDSKTPYSHSLAGR